jgi:putative NADPH-quinone reductase
MQIGGMNKRILIIQGHPDNTGPVHLCHHLATAYLEGADAAGHDTRVVDVAELDFPLLRSAQEWESGTLPPGLAHAQASIAWAQHIVLFFPLWLGDMPALFKGFLEQVARPGFALGRAGPREIPAKLLSGRSARVVVTMGMPAAIYRWYFRAHSVKALERNVLGFVGIAPIQETLIGGVGELDHEDVARWARKLRHLGAQGG